MIQGKQSCKCRLWYQNKELKNAKTLRRTEKLGFNSLRVAHNQSPPGITLL